MFRGKRAHIEVINFLLKLSETSKYCNVFCGKYQLYIIVKLHQIKFKLIHAPNKQHSVFRKTSKMCVRHQVRKIENPKGFFSFRRTKSMQNDGYTSKNNFILKKKGQKMKFNRLNGKSGKHYCTQLPICVPAPIHYASHTEINISVFWIFGFDTT